MFVDPQYAESEYTGRESIRRAFELGGRGEGVLAQVVERPEFSIHHSFPPE